MEQAENVEMRSKDIGSTAGQAKDGGDEEGGGRSRPAEMVRMKKARMRMKSCKEIANKQYHLTLTTSLKRWTVAGDLRSESARLEASNELSCGQSDVNSTCMMTKLLKGPLLRSPLLHVPPSNKRRPRATASSCPTKASNILAKTRKKWSPLQSNGRGVRWPQRRIRTNSGEWARTNV